ncbi:MAG: biopolymer transporter ExbD [Pirellulaceae bacterium]|nr:biopolymer transporter ExbD [Pirellulaceae bacterium]
MARKSNLSDKIPIDMTPMIDIVFQLLTFFIMSLKISTAEGDFNIKMPLAAPRAGNPDPNQLPPLKLRMQADSTGNLGNMTLAERSFNGADRWAQLHNYIASVVGEGSMAASAEVELDCDYNLKYENVINAVTAVSGRMGADGQIIKLVEKIKFSPPRKP